MAEDRESPDPRERPDDPAGTKPKVEPDSLVPAIRESLVPPPADVDSTAVEEEPDLLPQRVGAIGSPAALGDGIDPPEAPRFQFLLGALFALGVAALVGVVVVALQGRAPSSGPDLSWSPWHPTSNNPTEQIAEHVAREYRLGTGNQLVAVQATPLEVDNVPLTIVLRQAAADGGNVSYVNGKGVLYRMCGLGNGNCTIPGKPSGKRFFLIKREALELALYTFHFTDADNVVTFLPPSHPVKNAATGPKVQKKTVVEAMFFRRSDVDQQIRRPLASTLTLHAPLPAAVTNNPDAAFVDELTQARIFTFTLSPSNTDNHAFLVLQPTS